MMAHKLQIQILLAATSVKVPNKKSILLTVPDETKVIIL